MALDENSDAAVVWALLSRLWGQFAVAAAMEVAHATGCDVARAGCFGRNLHPRWVDVSYQEKPDLMAQAVADGWQWLSTSLTTITQLFRGTQHMEQCSEDIDNFFAIPYSGQGLSGRFDASVSQARTMVACVPMNVDDIIQFVEEIADDVDFASKAKMRDIMEAWE
eukprot:1048051-Pyramimonas_sp.AAC.1